MPDISMCRQNKCDKKDTCYRYTTKPSAWQTFAEFNHKNCEYYWRDDSE